MPPKKSEMQGRGMQCPICRSAFTDRAEFEEHVATCSVSDALDQMSASGLPPALQLAEIAKMGQIARMFLVAKEYDDATESERKLMHVCGECCAYVFAHTKPVSCTACGKGETMRGANEFIGSFMSNDEEADDNKRPLLN